MKEKTFKGKAVYQPAGKAGEYSKWACNFYVGCSNGCAYCYLKKGRGAAVLGGNNPELKKCFRDEGHALKVFEKELMENLPELQKHGLFFSFTTDPMLPETMELTIQATDICISNDIPVKILTKIDFTNHEGKVGVNQLAFPFLVKQKHRDKIALGFTLTGHNELEKGANTNAERIEAMKKLHDAGFKTFASIEPVIDFPHSLAMINLTYRFCDLYKIGLQSGKHYPKKELLAFFDAIICMYPGSKIYFKDSLLNQGNIDRLKLPSNCVTRDYNIFER